MIAPGLSGLHIQIGMFMITIKYCTIRTYKQCQITLVITIITINYQLQSSNITNVLHFSNIQNVFMLHYD